MATQANKYRIQVALPVDSPHEELRLTTFHDNMNDHPAHSGHTEPYRNLLHTVKLVTDIQLPSLSKETYETTDINDDGGIRKYNGGLVDAGEFTFTTEAYIDTLDDTISSANHDYDASTNGVDQLANFPFRAIDLNGNPMPSNSTAFGGLQNSGWLADSGDGLDIHGGNNPTTFRFFEFAPQGATEGADTDPPVTLKSEHALAFRPSMVNRLYQIDYEVMSGDSSGMALSFYNSSSNRIASLPLVNGQSHNFLTKVTDDSPFEMRLFVGNSYTSGSKLNMKNIQCFLFYTWEQMLTEDVSVFFKVTDEETIKITGNDATVSGTYKFEDNNGQSGSKRYLREDGNRRLAIHTGNRWSIRDTSDESVVAQATAKLPHVDPTQAIGWSGGYNIAVKDERLLFETKITNVETNAPIDGKITKTITAKVTGGITHG